MENAALEFKFSVTLKFYIVKEIEDIPVEDTQKKLSTHDVRSDLGK